MEKELIEASALIKSCLSICRSHLVGKEAILNNIGSAKHEGRIGKITDIIPSSDGDILALFYVYRNETKEFLNSKPWTRQYRQLKELDILS